MGEHVLLQMMVNMCSSPVGLAFRMRRWARTGTSELRIHMWRGHGDDLWMHVRTLDAVSRAAAIIVASRRDSFAHYAPLPGGGVGGHEASGYFADKSHVVPAMDREALLRDMVGWILLAASERAAVGVRVPIGRGMHSPSASSLFGDVVEMCGRALVSFAHMHAPDSSLGVEALRLAGALVGPVVPNAQRPVGLFARMRTLAAFGVGTSNEALATSFVHGDGEHDFVPTATHALWCGHCAGRAVAPVTGMSDAALHESMALAVEAKTFAETMAAIHSLTPSR